MNIPMGEENKNSLLIVDDDNISVKVLVDILSPEYTIYTATNGQNAIEKAKEYKPDLILLDIMMPDIDGYHTLSELKKDEETSKIPVVFLTGLNSDEDEEKALSLNASDYITKPIKPMIVKLRVRNQIQIVNQIRTIERLSLIDQLTGIPNRRCFDERLQMEWRRAKREQTPVSLLMIDLDKFKRINDTYGHQQGDIVLQAVVKSLQQAFNRPADFAARWGGEEFIVLLPNTSLSGAMNVAEKIRMGVEKTEIPYYEGVIIKLTVSIGVNSLIPEQDSSMNAFISNADKALYAAKEAGRNKVIYS
jgi:diguanylate cyclase (GGDEF)-like protein